MTEHSETVRKAIAALPPEARATALEAYERHMATQARPTPPPAPATPPRGRPKSLGAMVLFAFLILFTIATGNWVLNGCHNTLTETCQQHHTSSCH